MSTNEFPHKSPGQLTIHPVGSIRELWSLAYPLMLSLFSVSLMVSIDRFFLAKLSLEAFNAASEAYMFVMIFEYTLVSLVAVVEVLVGKAYGSQNYSSVARPVWTMIWLSIASFLLFWPLAYFGADLFFASSPNQQLASDYFSSLMAFGPFVLLNAAFSAFWIGRGKTRFITLCIAMTSLINALLDPLLIFGMGPLPALGVTGAGIATGISQLICSIVFLRAFLQPKMRKRYKTANASFCMATFLETIKLGMPQAVAILSQSAAWAYFFRIMAIASPEHLLVCGVSSAIFYLFGFVFDGVSKAATAISSNLIGANRVREIGRVCTAGIRVHIVFAAIIGIFLLAFPGSLLRLFVPEASLASQETLAVIQRAFFWVWLMLVGEAFLFLWGGVLLAFGDMRFIFLVNSVAVWVLSVFPAYVTTCLWHQGPDTASAVACMYYVVAGIAFFFRVRYVLTRRSSLSVNF